MGGRDAIGSLAVKATRRDRIEIVTGDRDLVQLVRDPVVKLLFTRCGVSDLDQMDEARVEEKFGVAAFRYAEFAILRGDPSDSPASAASARRPRAHSSRPIRAWTPSWPTLARRNARAPSSAGLRASVRGSSSTPSTSTRCKLLSRS